MPATLQSVDAILKDDYKSYWENLNQAVFILAQINKKTDSVVGRLARHAIHTGRSAGVGARQEPSTTELLPDADQQRHASVFIPIRRVYGRIQLDGPMIDQANSDRGAFIEGMKSEMDGIRSDSMVDTNRQLWGLSNGVMAQCGVTTAAVVVVLATTTTLTQMRHLFVNRLVDIGTVASPFTIAQKRTITAADPVNKTITISGAVVTTTAAHFVFNNGSGGASSNTPVVNDGQRELTGLQTIVGSTTAILHGLDPSTTPVWKPQVYTTAGFPTETGITGALMNNSVESGRSVELLVSNIGVALSVGNLLLSIKRNMDQVTLKGGFKAVQWSSMMVSGVEGGQPALYVDKDAPANSLYGLCPAAFVWHQVGAGWRWMDRDGSILSRVSNQDAYEATLFTYAELACGQRNANFAFTALTETTV